jgi:hypothetical protein
MRADRTFEERLSDSALSLVLLSQIPDGETIGDRLKVMKLLFLAEYRMFTERAKGLNFTFYRYKLGPFSKEVEELWDALKVSGYLQEDEEFALTDEGRRLAHAFRADVLENATNTYFNEAISSIAQQYGRQDRNEIMARVYDMQVFDIEGRRLRMRDASLGTVFTEALEPSEAKMIVSIDPGWLDTLAIALDPARRESLSRAMAQVRARKTLTHEHVWPAV